MAWLGFLKLFYLLFEHARTPFQPVLGPIACFVTPIPAERAKKQMNRQFPANQFESRPPAWQASALSIAPLPLWLQVLEIIDRLPAGFVSPKSKPGWGGGALAEWSKALIVREKINKNHKVTALDTRPGPGQSLKKSIPELVVPL